MTTEPKPLAKFSWRLKSNTGLTSEGSQDNVTPAMYGSIMAALAGTDQAAEIARLQAQVVELAAALRLADETIRMRAKPDDSYAPSDLIASVLDNVGRHA